jgi:PTS system cellobiose-specific IIC component
MCFICMGISALMYYPFVRAYERTLLQQDAENAKNEESDAMSPEPSQA